MSGAVSWKFSFEGLDAGLAKLREVNALLDSISKKQANFNLNGNSRSSNSNSNIPNEERVSGAGVAAGAAAGAAEGAGIANAGKSIRDVLNNIVIDFSKTEEEIKKQLRELIMGRHRHPDSPSEKPIPPKIPQVLSTWQKLQQKFANINKGTFGEILSGSSNKVVSSIGDVAQGFNLLKAVAIELFVAFEILKFAIKLLAEGIRNGAEAYQRGARFGNTVGSQYQTDSAFKAIGIDSPDLSQLQGQFNKKSGKYEAPGTDVILGAARAGQFGDSQQITNLASEFKEAMKDGAENAREMGNAAKANFRLAVQQTEIGREWKTLLSQLSAILSPLISFIQNFIKDTLHAWNEGLSMILVWLQRLKLIPLGNPDNAFTKVGGPSQKESVTSLGRLGFILPRAGGGRNEPEKQLVDINKNTRETVNKLSLVAAALATMGVRTIRTGLLPLQNYP